MWMPAQLLQRIRIARVGHGWERSCGGHGWDGRELVVGGQREGEENGLQDVPCTVWLPYREKVNKYRFFCVK
jgi:hypothetical protein